MRPIFSLPTSLPPPSLPPSLSLSLSLSPFLFPPSINTALPSPVILARPKHKTVPHYLPSTMPQLARPLFMLFKIQQLHFLRPLCASPSPPLTTDGIVFSFCPLPDSLSPPPPRPRKQVVAPFCAGGWFSLAKFSRQNNEREREQSRHKKHELEPLNAKKQAEEYNTQHKQSKEKKIAKTK